MTWALLVAILVLDVSATLLARRWSDVGGWPLLLTSGVLLGLAVIPFGILMRYKSMGIANLLWIVMSVATVAALDAIIFRQRLTGIQIAGFSLALFGVALANMSRAH